MGNANLPCTDPAELLAGTDVEPSAEDVARAEELWARFGWAQWERPSSGESESSSDTASSSACKR